MKKNYSTSLMDEDRSISSEEDLTGRNLVGSFVSEGDAVSVATDVVSVATVVETNKKNDEPEDDGLSVVSDGFSVATGVSCAGWSCASDAVSTIATSHQKKRNKVKDDKLTQFVDDMLSPITSATDFFFCQMKCAFPNAVEDMDEVMSSDLHHLFFSYDVTEGVKEYGASTQLEVEERYDSGV